MDKVGCVVVGICVGMLMGVITAERIVRAADARNAIERHADIVKILGSEMLSPDQKLVLVKQILARGK